MKTLTTKAAFAAVSLAFAAQAAAQVIFYEREGFQGESFTSNGQVANFERFGFDNRASSAEVYGERWEVCEGPRFSGRCFVLRPGRYPSLASMGLGNRLSSVRAVPRDMTVDNSRYAGDPFAARDFRRRGSERVYEANVTSVRAVVSAGPDQQRCWVDREQVSQSSRNVPGAVAGAIIGGIIGHQFGSGRGQDVATVGGAVAGGAIGSRVGGGGATEYRDVQRCEKVAGQPHTDYWDVTYMFRGTEHRVQMTAAPGPTVTVNEQGEPRGG